MVVLAGIDSNLKLLANRKEKYDRLVLNDKKVCKVSEIQDVKNDIEVVLIDTLSRDFENVLERLFYANTNYIKDKLNELLEAKNNELEEIKKVHDEKLKEIRKIISYIYSIDVLFNSFDLSAKAEYYLLDICKAVKNIEQYEKIICALNYIKKLLPKYVEGYKGILNILITTEEKSDLSFEKKQELYNYLCNISLPSDFGKIHTKVYNEDNTKQDYLPFTKDYLKFYEDSFLSFFKSCHIHIYGGYDYIEKVLANHTVSESYIDRVIKFIAGKYNFTIENELDKVKEKRYKNFDEIKRLIGTCLSYDGITDVCELITSIKENKKLPDYLKDTKYYKSICYIAQNIDVDMYKNTSLLNIMDDLIELMYNEFDMNTYYDLYKFNSMNLSHQIVYFKKFYKKLLENCKEKLGCKYEKELEMLLDSSKLRKYPFVKNNEKIKTLKNQIENIKASIKCISQKYDDFDRENYKMYLKIIGDIYNIDNLYEKIIKKKKSIFKGFKTKEVIEKEKDCIKDFLNDNKIKNEFLSYIASSIISDDKELLIELRKKLL